MKNLNLLDNRDLNAPRLASKLKCFSSKCLMDLPRGYLLFTLSVCFLVLTPIRAQEFSYETSSEGTLVKEGNKKVLFFQSKETSLNGKYSRANYIHPLYDLDEKILTEDFPEDHLHHRGIFWAWHQVLIGEKEIGDSWECKDFKWHVKNVSINKQAQDSIILNAHTKWTSPLYLAEGKEIPFVDEQTQITIFPATETYRIIDFKISLLALVEHLKVGGSNDVKGYGGFSARIKLPDDLKFYSDKKEITPTNEAVIAARWMDMQGSFNNDKKSGFIIIASKNNPYPNNSWILRLKNSMQNAVYPGKESRKISTSVPTTLSYRLIIYKGKIEAPQFKEFIDF